MSDAPVPPGQDHQEMIDAVLFKRNLDEVFLLLDFISGRPEKQLSSLVVPNPDGPDALNAQQVVKQLAGIRYPPTGAETDRAKDASFLLLAKDRLAALAYPARGLTIAYTALFSRTEKQEFGSRLWTRLLPGKSAKPQPARHDGSRGSLAESAFPGLSAQVRNFNALYIGLIWLTLAWLVLTTFAYWDVAMGRSTLQRIDEIHKDQTAFYQASPDFALDKACTDPQPQQAIACRRLQALAASEVAAKADLVNFRSCTGVWCNPIVHVLRWGFILCGLDGNATQSEESVSSLLSVFSNFVLPMMFGVLGTFVAAIRLVQTNVRDSTLSPRDLWNTVLSLPLGMVAGVAVGLFYSPATAPPSGTGSSAVNLTLTASGLGFLAGYASQTFFDMLDSMRKNVFNLNNNAPQPPTPPT